MDLFDVNDKGLTPQKEGNTKEDVSTDKLTVLGFPPSVFPRPDERAERDEQNQQFGNVLIFASPPPPPPPGGPNLPRSEDKRDIFTHYTYFYDYFDKKYLPALDKTSRTNIYTNHPSDIHWALAMYRDLPIGVEDFILNDITVNLYAGEWKRSLDMARRNPEDFQNFQKSLMDFKPKDINELYALNIFVQNCLILGTFDRYSPLPFDEKDNSDFHAFADRLQTFVDLNNEIKLVLERHDVFDRYYDEYLKEIKDRSKLFVKKDKDDDIPKFL